MIVLDASVLIGHFESADAHHVDATALLKAHASESFAASVVTLAEVYVGPARAGCAEQLDLLLGRLQIESLVLPAVAARRPGELRAAAQLRMPDCCVLYSAEQHTAAIATFHDRLAARAVDLGLTVVA